MTNPQAALDALQKKLMQTLDWAYDQAISGAPGIDSAEELAASYAKFGASAWDQAGRLINMQTVKAGTAGFVTGLGGVLTLPLTLPANLTSVYFIQLRMIAAIALLGGYDIRDDQVRTLCYACLVGRSAAALLQGAGVTVGQKVAIGLIKKIPGAVLTKINQAVGFRLLTKFGSKGVINLGRALPLVWGPFNAAFDAATTKAAGTAARRFFIAPDEKIVVVSSVRPPARPDRAVEVDVTPPPDGSADTDGSA